MYIINLIILIMKKGFGLIGVLIFIGVIIIISSKYYYSNISNNKIENNKKVDIILDEAEKSKEMIEEKNLNNKGNPQISQKNNSKTNDLNLYNVYKNDTWNFSLEYPKDWDYFVNGEKLSPPEKLGFKIFSPNDNKISIIAISGKGTPEKFAIDNSSWRIKSKENFIVSGHTATKYWYKYQEKERLLEDLLKFDKGKLKIEPNPDDYYFDLPTPRILIDISTNDVEAYLWLVVFPEGPKIAVEGTLENKVFNTLISSFKEL